MKEEGRRKEEKVLIFERDLYSSQTSTVVNNGTFIL
jgi:hypothetical protein